MKFFFLPYCFSPDQERKIPGNSRSIPRQEEFNYWHHRIPGWDLSFNSVFTKIKSTILLTLSVQIKYAYANHSLLALGAPGKTQVSRISCFDDYPLPECVSKSRHIGQLSIVPGTENTREASSMEKPSGTLRPGTLRYGIVSSGSVSKSRDGHALQAEFRYSNIPIGDSNGTKKKTNGLHIYQTSTIGQFLFFLLYFSGIFWSPAGFFANFCEGLPYQYYFLHLWHLAFGIRCPCRIGLISLLLLTFLLILAALLLLASLLLSSPM